MSGTLIFGQNRSTNSLHAVEVDATGVVAVDVHGGGTGSGDMKARTDIADPATSTFLKCNPDGTLDISVAIDETGLATEAKQDDMITDLSQIATNTSRLAPQLNRTEAIPVQIMVGSGGTEYDALRANGQDLMVMIDDMNPDVAVNSGLSTSALQTAGNTILTDGTQEAKCMGNNGGSQVQIKVDANGVVETSGGGGGGGDASAANQVLQLAQETTTATQTTATATSVASMDGKITICDTGATGITSNTDPTKATSTLQTAGNASLAIVAGAVSGNEFQCDVVTSVLPAGSSTSANQSLQLAQETVTATNSSSIDNKISQGSDVTLTNAQQVLCYGRDSGGTLDALLTDASGHLEVVVDDFVKGQDTMANSFPVVIASDQSSVATSSTQLPASLGQKANSGSISTCRSTTAGAYDLSARTTIATAGTSTKLLCDSDGKLSVTTVPPDEVTISQIGQTVINPASFTSTAVDMRGYERISFFGNSTNTADEIYVLVSADDITYYTTGAFVTKDFTTGDFSYDGTLGARYFKLRQGSGDFGGNFTISCISSKK